MKLSRIVALAFIACCVDLPATIASPATFWLSSSNIDPDGPEAPEITGLIGATRDLHIWAQPATVNPAAVYNVNTNRFRTLRNFSLNLITNEAIVDFVDGTFTVYNPELDGSPRFQFASDSHTPTTEVSAPLTSELIEADVIGGAPDAVKGLQAFSIATAGFAGLGHSPIHTTVGCHPADPFCALTNDGSPAWLVGSVAFKTLATMGTAPLFLQVGANGMNYQGDSMQVSEVAFGINGLGLGPLYDARVPSQRGTTLPGDDPDATIHAIAAIAGDFNSDSVVDAADYVVWRNGLGTTHIPAQYDLWRAHFGQTSGSGSIASSAVPEPATSSLLVGGMLVILAGRRAYRLLNALARLQRRSRPQRWSGQFRLLGASVLS